MKRFLQRMGARVAGVLHGFDRLRFRGSKRQLSHVAGLMCWLGFARIPLKEFRLFARDTTAALCQSIEAPAEAAGVFEYVNNLQASKEEAALAIARRHGRREGLIAVLSCVEPCQTMQVRGNPKPSCWNFGLSRPGASTTITITSTPCTGCATRACRRGSRSPCTSASMGVSGWHGR